MNRTFGSLLLAVGGLVAGLGAQSLPAGFVAETFAGGMVTPVGIDHLPDGRLIVIEQVTARVRVVSTAGAVGLVGTVQGSTVAGGRSGLGGVAVDPGWPSRPFLYFHYTVQGQLIQRVDRYTVSGDLVNPASTNLSMSGRYTVLDGLPDQIADHNGSALAFAPDGMLFVSLGDDYQECTAQDPLSRRGSILRINVNGLPPGPGGPPALWELEPAGNPWPTASPEERLLWAVGLRNPWRMAVDDRTGALAIGDVGNVTYEEVNFAEVGGLNFEWPLREGPMVTGLQCGGSTLGLFAPPVQAITHASLPGPKSVLILDVYRNEPQASLPFGAAYEGTVFYADYFQGHIRRLERTIGGWRLAVPAQGQPSAEDWATGFNSVADAVRGIDGSLYLAMHARGTVVRIRRGTAMRSMSIVNGGGQVADAGRALPGPISVELRDQAGVPEAGVPVTFLDQTGGGVFQPAIAITDASGIATTTFTTGLAPLETVAFEPSGASLSIPLTWRGLGVTHVVDPNLGPYLFFAVAHSRTASPFTLAIELDGYAPPVPTPFGEILSGLVIPHPYFAALDGLGLFGPADPAFVTGAQAPVFHLTIFNPPLFGGLTLAVQAFAFDPALAASGQELFVSNIGRVTLP